MIYNFFDTINLVKLKVFVTGASGMLGTTLYDVFTNDTNAEGALNVALACKELGTPLVHISTAMRNWEEALEEYLSTDYFRKGG